MAEKLKGIDPLEIANDAESQSGVNVPSFKPEVQRLASSFDGTASYQPTLSSGDIYNYIQSQIPKGGQNYTPNFSDQDQGITPDFLVEPLSYPDYYPGLQQPEVVAHGQYAGGVGSRPLFSGGGALFPQEIVNARKRAIARAALGAQQRKDATQKVWGTLQSADTYRSFQSQAKVGFNTFMDDSLNNLAREYNGDVYKAAATLLNPLDKKGQQFLKEVESRNAAAKDVLSTGELVEGILKDKDKFVPPYMLKKMQEFAEGVYDYEEFIKHPEKLQELKSYFRVAPAIEGKVNEKLTNFKDDIQVKLQNADKLFGNDRIKAYEKIKYQNFDGKLYNDRLNSIADQVMYENNYDQFGVSREYILEVAKSQLGREKQVIDKSMQTFTLPKESSAGSPEANAEIYYDIYQNLEKGKLPIYDAMSDQSKGTQQERYYNAISSMAQIAGGKPVNDYRWKNTFTIDRTPPTEIFAKPTKAHSSVIFVPSTKIGQESGLSKIGSPSENMESLNDFSRKQLNDIHAEIIAKERAGEDAKELRAKYNEIAQDVTGFGRDIDVKPTREFQQYGYFDEKGKYVVPTMEQFDKDPSLFHKVKPYTVREYNIIKATKPVTSKETSKPGSTDLSLTGEEKVVTKQAAINSKLPETVYEIINTSDKAIAGTLGQRTYGGGAETRYGKTQEYEPQQQGEFEY